MTAFEKRVPRLGPAVALVARTAAGLQTRGAPCAVAMLLEALAARSPCSTRAAEPVVLSSAGSPVVVSPELLRRTERR